MLGFHDQSLMPAFAQRFVAFSCPFYQNSILLISVKLYELATAKFAIEVDALAPVMTAGYRHRGYRGAFLWSLVTVPHFHISYSYTILLWEFFWPDITSMSIWKRHKMIPHGLPVTGFSARPEKCRENLCLRPTGGTFGIVLNEQRSKLWGYDAVYLRGSFSTWKCPIQGSWVKTFLVDSVTHTLLWRPL